MESFYQLAEKRRSIRKYTNQEISQEIIDKLLVVALMSPASKRSNPWEFIVVNSPELLEKLAECKPHGASFIKEAPLAIVVIADSAKSDVWVEDTSIASIYLQLAAEDMGLGSCWVQVHKRKHASGIDSSEFVKELLQIPSNFEVESIISFGYKNEERQAFDTTKALYERIHTNKF